jgi:hypothetical protein
VNEIDGVEEMAGNEETKEGRRTVKQRRALKAITGLCEKAPKQPALIPFLAQPQPSLLRLYLLFIVVVAVGVVSRARVLDG